MDSRVERHSWLERVLPPRSARRALAITGMCLGALVGALHYEVGRLKESQEAGIGQVKAEIGTQGKDIRDPLLETVGQANETLKEGQKKLDICERVANQVGIDLTKDPSHQTTTTISVPPQQELAVTPTTTTP